MLTDRQLLILQILIDEYIQNAEPLGSRSISKRQDITFSSATIRNELADLEDMGFIEKTHSSSGRIPSEKGYRFYVDHLLSPVQLQHHDLAKVHSLFQNRMYEQELLIEHSANLLSEITNYTSIILGPEVYETKLKHLQIVPISKGTAIFVLITDTGHVEKYTVDLPPEMNASDLERTVNILNDRLKGVPFSHLKVKLQQEVQGLLKAHIENYEQSLDFLAQLFQTEKSDKVYYGGKTNILNQPEFQDVNKVKALYNAIEQQDLIQQLLYQDGSSGINVKIGAENTIQEMKNCSLITANYSIGGQHMGTLAILGPTRMEYHRVIGLLDLLSKDLTKVLTQRYYSN
ncbi:heat-inducible transcriptional repressor HrcA [Pseudalkalibacillus berkeleyi]|uniref:Heat-inducible transcription repressor HrcA n=1 Tax=Pseudalkalibacillus berkeleyi TaxID=1069813 RepID=A0ABS9GYY8_9BACL|nr:heat-inducible transcriptional repressor HrcA [Pseudalkalibacillus berkeleyi]MCF6137982.1 heat-inducible transcriptional repressor HrcA [Pseudalkalibacillus berkeleyi]